MAPKFLKICFFLLGNLAIGISAQKLKLLHVLSANKFYAPDYNLNSSVNFEIPKNLSYEYFLKNSWDIPNSVKLDIFKIGEFLRRNYDHHLGSMYEDESMQMKTTEFPVSIMAGELINAGLWPPAKDQIWNSDLLWQPIPFVYNKAEEDPVLLGTQCPNFKAELQKVLNNHSLQADHQNLLNDISKKGQVNVTNPIDASLLYLALENSVKANQTHPEWLKKIYSSQSFHNISLSAYELLSKTTIQKQLNGGTFLKSIITDSKKHKNGTLSNKRKVNIYSGDERNLAGVMKNLGYSMSTLPNPGTALIFELWSDDTIKIILYDGTDREGAGFPIKLENCEMLCPLDKFEKLLADVLPEDELSLCNNSANTLVIFNIFLVSIFSALYSILI